MIYFCPCPVYMQPTTCPPYIARLPGVYTHVRGAARLHVIASPPKLGLRSHSVPLSIAAVGGIRRWTCLSPPQVGEFSASRQQREAQGNPKGRFSGVPFSCSFFWASKRRRFIRKFI